MSINLPDYKITETIHQGDHTVIYRGVKQIEEIAVIIKTLKSEYPTLEEITRLRHEYQILDSLEIEGIKQTYALENYSGGLALILPDFGGICLKSFINTKNLELSEFLSIAIQLTSNLSQLHQNNIIHKDIKPHNVLINPETGQVKIIDFSIASRLSRENPTLSNPNLLEGTLAYMSPEQTGRMNRSLDYRTDFYSLGITFYELLTHELPFSSTDPLELVHCHIAKQPVPPAQLNPEVSTSVSDIVMKLLAKTAEERYQNALGLKADLENCLTQLRTTGHIEQFVPGQLDLCSQFLIPQKLYGRNLEVASLFNSFQQVCKDKTEIMLVSGYSGVGKTSLVNEVHKLILRQRSYFISGKFDQFKQNIPYASLIQAFQDLIRQVLTDSSEKIIAWKSKLIAAFGSHGQVIIDVIPELDRIVGQQPAIPTLGPAESQNRFNRVFQKFIHVFSQPEHPLVLFLDDLQWVDSASLKLIQLILTEPNSQCLLLIGAYRDNEVSATHPLMLTLNQIQLNGAIVNNIILRPLDIYYVSQLVSETLHIDIEKATDLAELVFRKTQGNPFFLTQLLKSLHEDNLLSFNFSESCWQWNIEQLQAIKITDNVVELMVNQIQRLAQKTQNVLTLAACIGDKFTLDILAIVNEQSLSETAADLWEALQAGLILPLSEAYKIPLVLDPETSTALQAEPLKVSYKFLHDRVQQAAYSLIPDSQKKETHLKIGQLILQNNRPEEQKENIFSLVNQLNYGSDLLTLEAEKYQLAELNLITSQKAKAATAYEAAIRYLNVGLSLLSASSWHKQYELTLALHQEAAEVAFLSGDFEQMEQLAEVVLQQAKTQLDKVKTYEVRIKTYEVQRKLLEAVKLGLQVLEILGVKLPELPTSSDIQHAIEETTANLAGKGIEDLINLPSMTDVNKLAALRLIASLVPAAYQSAPALFILMACQEVNLSIKYGNTVFSASGFADYGVVFSGLLQEIETAYEFGELALNLLDRLDAREARSQTLFKVATFILPWKHHVAKTFPLLEDAYSSGLENGDLAHTGYSASHKCQYLYWSGFELKSLKQEMASYGNAIAQINQETALKWHQIFHQVVLNLIGLAENPCCLVGEAYNEEQLLPFHIQLNERTAIHYLFLNKLILCYLLGDFTQAVENAIKAERYLDGVRGWLAVPLFHFYDSLAQLGLYLSVPHSQQENLLTRVINNQKKMQKWANYAPMNFQHKYELVEAEKARVLGQVDQASTFYECAIQGARKQGYIQEEALAAELAAKFYYSQEKEHTARQYLTQSYYAYSQWGAIVKVRDLEAKYPHIFSWIPKQKKQGLEMNHTIRSTITDGSGVLNLAAVIKASQALSSEILLGNLLKKLMQIVIESAGAQTGILILEKAGELFIEASGRVDKEEITVQQSVPVKNSQELPIFVINYVARTQEDIVLNDATCEEVFNTDPYIIHHQPKSILCTPILHQGKLTGILYLENNLTTEAFTLDRLEILQLLSSQAAISIENARLYTDLESAKASLEMKVEERTLELQEKNLQLQQEISVSEAVRRERQQAEEAANAANRAKSEFLANMSHELRTPLNGILGYAQILRRDNTLADRQKDGLAIIYKCGEHLLTLINDILDLSKIEAQKMELHQTDFNFPEFVEGLAEICRIRAKQKGLSLIYEPLTQLPERIWGDEKRLRQVLMNLLGNAVKFTEEGGVSFKVGYVVSASSLSVQDGNKQATNPKIRFQVEDTGIGMSAEQLKEIFLPFKQVGEYSRKIEGTGLGLAISRQLVEMMGSKLQVKSTLNKGSVFWLDLELPEVTDSAEVTKVIKRIIVGFKGHKQKVIVADDKWENRSVLVNLLLPLGFEIIEAKDGQDCLNKAEEFQPDLILTDLVMPILDGFEVTRRIRHSPNLKRVIVIATSASVFDFDQQKSSEAGCNDFIPKPIREEELLERLRTHLGLEWIYEEKEEAEKYIHTPGNMVHSSSPNYAVAPIEPPPAEEITALFDLAMMGDLRGIAEQTLRLEKLNESWIPFTSHLRQLAKDFEEKKILKFLKQYLVN